MIIFNTMLTDKCVVHYQHYKKYTFQLFSQQRYKKLCVFF